MNINIVDRVQGFGRASASRPRMTALLLACGVAALAAAGAASASPSEDDVLSKAVHYDPQSLATDQGARLVYRRIANAAAAVCPDPGINPHWVSDAARECRRQAIARAVQSINNPRLVAIHSSTAKSG